MPESLQVRAARAHRELALVLDAAACDAEDGTIDEPMLEAVVAAVAEYRYATKRLRSELRTVR